MNLRLHKMAFYAEHALTDAVVPRFWWLQRRDQRLSAFHRLPSEIRQQLLARARYYNRLQQPFAPAATAEAIGRCCGKGKSSAYYYDFRNAIRYFPPQAKVAYQFGDITAVPEQPHFVKSRPIATGEDNANSVLLKLNSVRHYFTVRDKLRFEDKKPLAVWRGKSNQAERIAFARQYRQHPLCNIGCVQHKETASLPPGLYAHRPAVGLPIYCQRGGHRCGHQPEVDYELQLALPHAPAPL